MSRFADIEEPVRQIELNAALIRARLAKHATAPPPVPGTAPWMDVAWGLFGEREIPGKQHNPRIVSWLARVAPWMARTKGDETPWCSAYADEVMRLSGKRGTGKPNARSWLRWGKECEPRYGAVAVLWRGSPGSSQGHVAFLVRVEQTRLLLLGGNQGNAVSVRWYDRNRLLALRWPG